MNEVIDIMARTLFGESEPGNRREAEAIACVIMNRTRHYPKWPKTPDKVCLQPWQFSCWNPGDPNRARIMRASGEWFEKCKAVATEAVNGTLHDITNGATHYYATYIGEPKWAKGHKPCFAMSHSNGSYHLFFNDIDTKPPTSAKEALDQKRPLSSTRTMKGSAVATAGAVGTGTLDMINSAKDTLGPMAFYSDTIKWVFLSLTLAGILYVIYARWQDRRKGVK